MQPKAKKERYMMDMHDNGGACVHCRQSGQWSNVRREWMKIMGDKNEQAVEYGSPQVPVRDGAERGFHASLLYGLEEGLCES
jgi:hypothetical protein